MTLEELIDALRFIPASTPVEYGFGSPHSWRGSYSELAFQPVRKTTVGAMQIHAQSALYATFTGYKGGTYRMDPDTPVHIQTHDGCDDDDELTALLLEKMVPETKSSETAPKNWRKLWKDAE